MSKHMTIINLACTITKLRKWGEAWKHSAESAQAATARMHQAHEAKMVEHRAAFGARTEADAKIIAGLRSEIGAAQMAVLERDSLISERDGLLTQVQDMRAEINRLTGHNADAALHDLLRREYDKALTLCETDEQTPAECIAALQERMRASIVRGDFEQMEVAALKSQSKAPKYKVGDKLESYNRLLGLAIPVTIVGVRTVYDCQADGAEYPVGHSEDELTERYEQTPPEATHAEPDLTQLHAKGSVAWSDVPNATQWVEEMRGNSEATHDTDAGKASAESAVRTEPVAEEIKVGDVVEVVSNTGRNTWLTDVGSVGTVTSIETLEDSLSVRLKAVPDKKNVCGGYVSICDVRKVTT